MSKRALISVYNKTGIVNFTKELIKNGYEIISTSGTAKLLRENGIKIKTIEEITGSPEILGGRVKTLQYQIFAGILADRGDKSHSAEIQNARIIPFELVVVSLYPFSETIKKPDCTEKEAIEQIDIGGVSLIRAAAKNFRNVCVLVTPEHYSEYIDSLNNGKINNLKFASKAFDYIARYDIEISDYFKKLEGKKSGRLVFDYGDVHELRYGENPHQKGKLYDTSNKGFSKLFEKLHGKELSYINILDIDAAYNLIAEFDEPSCVIVKHKNPCGAASSNNVLEAYKKAFACDTASPFGGIVIVNRLLDMETASEIDKIFTEIVIAPQFSGDALDFLMQKKNRRIIRYAEKVALANFELKTVTGGLLVQDRDGVVVNKNELKIVSKRKPEANEIDDLVFALKVCKHTVSNSVIYAKNKQTLGIGGGQPSRVDSSRIAVEKAKRFGLDLSGSAVASDAFFPFPDGVIEAAKAGAKSVIQPGGSVNDDEVIKAANENGIAMVFTGIRHFKH